MTLALDLIKARLNRAVNNRLIAEIERLREHAEKMAEALEFYADKRRYEYDYDCCACDDNPGQHEAEAGALQDGGQRARSALDDYRKARG